MLTVLAVAACQPRPEPLYLEGSTMGTTYHVTVTSLPPSVSPRDVQRVIDAVLQEVDTSLSTWRSDSELSAINGRDSADWTPVSDDLHAVVAEALRVSRATGGAFDVTVGPLVDLWGFGRTAGSQADPTDAQLQSARGVVGFSLVELRRDPPAIRKLRAGVRIDVAGIAPGFAVDRIAERLQRLRIVDALVEVGGEVRAWGRSPAGRGWRVAVEAPVAGERRAYTLAELDGMSISTSGDYRDFRVSHGRRISHTIDPRTGRPVAHGLASVTVLHPSAMTADAYATALMVLGPVDGPRFARDRHLAALFLERVPGASSWRETVTPEFARLRRPVP